VVLVLVIRIWSWSCYFGLNLGLKNLVSVLRIWYWSCYFGLGLGLKNLVLLTSLEGTQRPNVLDLLHMPTRYDTVQEVQILHRDQTRREEISTGSTMTPAGPGQKIL